MNDDKDRETLLARVEELQRERDILLEILYGVVVTTPVPDGLEKR